MGISLLCELDALVFVYRHGTSLTSADEIARLIGYESAIMGGALDRLEREKLIERSEPSHGVNFYTILASPNAGRQRCLQQILSLSQTRAGRVLLVKRLKPVDPQVAKDNRLSLEREGKWLCLKAI